MPCFASSLFIIELYSVLESILIALERTHLLLTLLYSKAFYFHNVCMDTKFCHILTLHFTHRMKKWVFDIKHCVLVSGKGIMKFKKKML